MKVTRSDGPFGVEIRDLDPADERVRDEDLQALLREHRLLVFPGVELSAEAQVAFLTRFGRVIVEIDDAATRSDPDKVFGKASYVTTRPNQYISGRGPLRFHSDFSFYADGPGEVLSLYAIEADGDDPTIFVNMVLAMQSIPAALERRLRGLELVKCCNFFHDGVGEGGRYHLSDRDPAKDYGNTASRHPAIGRHRVTGEELPNVCQLFSDHFTGMTEAESRRLFEAAEPWQYAEAHRHRHHWRPGDLVVWDNIALQHGRDPVAGTSSRHLRRVVSNPWDIAELQQRTGRAALAEATPG